MSRLALALMACLIVSSASGGPVGMPLIAGVANYELDSTWAPQWNNLIWYWKMNGGTGPVSTSAFPVDKGGTTCTGVAGRSAYVAQGKVNQAINSTVLNVSMSCAGSVVNAIANNITVGGWMKINDITALAFGGIVYSYSVAAGTGFKFQRNNATNSISIRVDTDVDVNRVCASTTNVIDGNWHYVAFTLSSGTTKLYIDGALDKTCAYTQGTGIGFSNANTSFSWGPLTTDGSSFYDDWGIWNVALSPTEIQTIYNTQLNARP